MALFSFFKKVSKTNYLIALTALLMRAGFFMSLPFLAVYLTRDGLLTPSQIGIVIGAVGLAFSITGLFNGTYIDRHSPKNILIIALILSGLCYFALAFSMRLFFVLLCINVALGWLRSLADISSLSVIMDNTEKKYLSYAYSMRFMALNLGVALGPLIGAAMASQHSVVIFYIAAIIHIVLGFSLLFFIKNPLKQNTTHTSINFLQNLHELWRDKILINIVFINFIIWTAYAQLDATMPQYITHTMPNPAILVTEMLVTNALICVLFQPAILRLAERTSLKISGVIGSLLFSATFILIAFHPTAVTFIIAAAMLSLGELFTLPINGLLAMRIAPKHLVASYNGLVNFGLLGTSVGPIIGGYGLQYIGSKYLFLGLALLLIIVVWRYLTTIPD